ncbi:hypothetical protein EBZ80_01985 [bacterium]|nr:hypothetical protein [bacterium]
MCVSFHGGAALRALPSLSESYAAYWLGKFKIQAIHRLYVDTETLCSRHTSVVFSYTYTGQSTGVFWGSAVFDNCTNQYTYLAPLTAADDECQFLWQTTVVPDPYLYTVLIDNCLSFVSKVEPTGCCRRH